MNVDLKNSLTFAQIYGPISLATNNTASVGLDTQNYIGQLAVRIAIGVKTAGDNDGAVNVVVQASATNAASTATNITATTNAVATTNNTAAAGVVVFDKRSEYRYLFVRVTFTGTNSPAYPISVGVVGMSEVQPVQ